MKLIESAQKKVQAQVADILKKDPNANMDKSFYEAGNCDLADWRMIFGAQRDRIRNEAAAKADAKKPDTPPPGPTP